jgi:PAS domain S-box-containing protein
MARDDFGSSHPEVSAAEWERRKAFVGFTEDDVQALRALHPVAERYADEVIEGLYQRFFQFEETRIFFSDESILKRVKTLHKQYFLGLTRGDYGAAYLANRLQVGRVHQRIGLLPHWYMGAYSIYKQLVFPHVMSAFGKDITKAQRAYVALLKIMTLDQEIARTAYSERRFRALIENASDLVSVLDAEGVVRYASPSHERLLGYAGAELIGRRSADYEHPDDSAQLREQFTRLLGRPGGTERIEFRYRHKDGTWRVFEGISTNLIDDPAVRGVVVNSRDMTERVRSEEARAQLEAQLRVAQKMEALGTLAGGIAHDFNNILGAITGNVELAGQDVGSSHPAMESLQEIRKASRRAKDLVQRILAFGRPQSQPQTVIRLRPVVEEALALLRATLPTGIELVTALEVDTPTARADPTQIHQLLMNLCTNAWHAMDRNLGRIDIRLDGITLDAEAAGAHANLRPGRFARLCVTDNGSGMDAATLERIFDPFFTTKPVGQGTGLGLSVVHGIVEAHGGAVTVRSERGTGTTFSLYFPAAEAPQPSDAPEGAAAEPLPAPRGQHVLYLDDEESLVFLVTRLLERLGYRVSGYTRAEEALAAVRADPGQFDLVVTDLNMPGVSGLEVARELARLQPDLPVALTSGYITEELRAAAGQAGVRELIYKPNTVEELCEAVRRLAGASKKP